MLDNKMKETCRICGRDLYGNQRRWIFHPATKLNLQVLLSHALGQELARDGRGEFACSKCAFMLDRMYRFDTVIARVEALSIERLQRLLQEKHRLRQCIGGLYRKTNSLESTTTSADEGEAAGDGMVDISGLTHAKYCALLQEDLVYSLYESWADDSTDCHHHHHPQSSAGPGSDLAGPHRCMPTTPRRCRGCSHWRVADSDYEAVCKVPRKLARSTSCGPSTRYSASFIGGSGAELEEKGNGEEPDEPPSSLTLVPASQDVSRTSDSDQTLAGRVSSSPSIASLETTEDYIQHEVTRDELLNSPKEPMDARLSDTHPDRAPHGQSSPGPSLSLALCLLQNYAVHRPVQSKGSKLPVLLRRSSNHGRLDLSDPILELTFGTPDGEPYQHMATPELEAPSIQLNVGSDHVLNRNNIEDIPEDVYFECPPPKPHQNLVEEQQSQLNQYECAAGQCVSELQKAQMQVESLQAKIHESDSNNMKLQEKLNEMECELRSLRQASQSQERTIQDLTESIGTKDTEAQELYQLIEGQNVTLYKLRDMAHRNQIAQTKSLEGVSESAMLSQLQGELVAVQSSLFSLGLDLEASQRSLRQSQRQGEDLARFKDRLNADLQEALQHREETEKHNQDLCCMLQKTRAELQVKEEALKEAEAERLAVIREKDRSIAQLRHSLQDKERHLQEYSEMLETPGSSKPRDALLEKLRERIKDRDKALERSIDDKFRCLDEREGQVRTLQLALREKDRDLDRLRCILSNNEETITSLDALVRGKELELEQAAEAYRNLQWLKQQSEEKERSALREKDAIIGQLQAALQARSKEPQVDLTAALVGRVQAGAAEVVEELKARLLLKEKLFQELLSDRSRQSSEHQTRVSELLNTLGAKDQYLQDNSYRLSLVISERTGQLQEVRKQLSQREQELCELRRDKERETGGDVQHLQGLLREKEAFIKEMMHNQEEVMMQSSTESEAEVKALQEELQLLLKKEKEAQEELATLRSTFAAHQAKGAATACTEHVLEQLVSEYRQLNGALKAEKRLYQNLVHANSDSSNEVLALHTQLDSVQALRGQLEEVLGRIQNMALDLERASKRQPDLGDVSSEDEEGDDEDGSGDEFTDSIEEDDKVTSASLSSSQTQTAHGQESEFPRTSQQTVEVELKEIQSELEREGFTSVTQMRSTLQRLRKENQFLKEHHGSLHRGEEDDDTEEEEDYMDDDDDEGVTSSEAVKEFEPAGGVSEPGLSERSARLCSENRELQERLMVSEATVHAQAEQLKDYRDLLKTSVQQASKQVQVDLQDLGYETCGRSENEAEREDASSPEFDDLEMCTSLSHQQEESLGGDWYKASRSSRTNEIGDESALHHLVQDLRSQLTRCHKVIRGLQMRVRSLSTTSDYASSLERTPRKVNWAFEMSPAHEGVEEDEGWMSDTQATPPGSKPSRELQELIARVATLEAQLKSSKLEGKSQTVEEKCTTWPGKYNSLIQAQARELSHLRQRIREGEGISHILTQHLGDTTKAFEELLRANDVDYYTGQSFRAQLSQSTALAQRLLTKLTGRAESPVDNTGHELLALQLSKELQQKDQIIESLHNKLQQRPETPSSCQALSETTDPSDRTSLVSDESQTNEDLDLCSDLDARDYQEQEQRLQSDHDAHLSIPPPRGPLKSCFSCPGTLSGGLTSPSLRAPLGIPFSSSLPPSRDLDVRGTEFTYEAHPRALSVMAGHPELDTLYKQMNEQIRGFPETSGKPLFALSPGALNQCDLSGYNHHAFQQYQLGGIPEGHSHKSDSGMMTGGGTFWDNMTQSMGNYSGIPILENSQTGPNVIGEHLREVRCLRQRLEESIRTNERLRQQLEEKLANPGRDGGAPTNIYIQGLDTVTHLSNEIRVLTDENLNLQSRLQASTGKTHLGMFFVRPRVDDYFLGHSDSCEELIAARARLKQAELEAEQWKEELRRLQTHSEEQGQQILALRQERQAGQERINRAQHESSLLQQQLSESRELIHSLQSELHVYDRVCSSSKSNKGFLCEATGLPVELGELLSEVRSLRAQLQSGVQESSALKQLELHKQLEQKLGGGSPRTPALSALSASPQRENVYKRQLLHDPAPSPPVRDIGLFNCGSPCPPYSDLDDNHSAANDPLDPHTELEGDAPDGSFANRYGRHAVGHVDDFNALQQQVLEGRSIVQRMETALSDLSPLGANQKQSSELFLEYGNAKSLLANTKTLRQILEEAASLLKMFWRAALPSTDASIPNLKKEQSMQEEILSLKLRVSEQEELLKGMIQRLRSTSRTKENMEHFIVNQLSRTRDVLKKARTNLEKNELRLSSLSSSSSSPYTAKEPGGGTRKQPADVPRLRTAYVEAPAARKRTSQCLL
ncbi:myomegalin isoform X4 [Syngnathus typhle]|uniref:myomegalin isoform X4 n=1 Tax=Syngnathus typhle TaxID=161592 RepID=UPI002A6B7764|nr:myomegalin isoform X4 [Syngnathus typhle]